MTQSRVALSTTAQFRGAEIPESCAPELSVVIPCLNEAATIAQCVGIALETMQAHGISGEVVVADNGSTDLSPQLAAEAGARVIRVSEKGYGQALMGGIAAAHGRYVVMGDADLSYDFTELPRFLAKLREGYTLVQGCRLESGGGKVLPGAMPFLHRWVGNPFFSMLVRTMFQAPIHDVNCGLRAFSKELYDKLEQRCTGMEFAVEMVLKASLRKERIAEVPITLHPDGRGDRAPHLRTFHDGWRTLRFFLMSSPRWLFLYPGILLMLFGLLGYGLAFPPLTIGGVTFGVNTLLAATLSILAGYQAVLFSVSAKTFAMTEGLLPPDPEFAGLFRYFNLERGLIAAACLCAAGFVLFAWASFEWFAAGFGALNPEHSLRLIIPATLSAALGVQTLFGSFFLSLLGLRRK